MIYLLRKLGCLHETPGFASPSRDGGAFVGNLGGGSRSCPRRSPTEVLQVISRPRTALALASETALDGSREIARSIADYVSMEVRQPPADFAHGTPAILSHVTAPALSILMLSWNTRA
jgi:exopolyphosphatase/pppGpp-phosphohydrolase